MVLFQWQKENQTCSIWESAQKKSADYPKLIKWIDQRQKSNGMKHLETFSIWLQTELGSKAILCYRNRKQNYMQQAI